MYSDIRPILTPISFGPEPRGFRQPHGRRHAQCHVIRAKAAVTSQALAWMSSAGNTLGSLCVWFELIFYCFYWTKCLCELHTQLWGHDPQLTKLVVEFQVCVIFSLGYSNHVTVVFWILGVLKDMCWRGGLPTIIREVVELLGAGA